MAITALSNFVVTLEKAFTGAWHQAFGGNAKGRSASLALDNALSNYTSLSMGQPYPTNPSVSPPTATTINGSLAAVGSDQGGYIFTARNFINSIHGVGNASGMQAVVNDAARDSKILTLSTATGKTRFEVCGDGTIFMPDNTTFPTTPQTGDTFYHSTRGIHYYYDGTQWLSTQLFTLSMPRRDFLDPTTTTGIALAMVPYPDAGGGGIYLVNLLAMCRVDTTAGANFYTMILRKNVSPNTDTTIATITTSGQTAGNYVRQTAALNLAFTAGGAESFDIICSAKTGTPGNLISNFALSYRLVG